jgi:hypothetical protein
MAHAMTGTDFSCERREPQRRAQQKRWQMRPNLQRPRLEYRASRSQLIDINNHLILRYYFVIGRF